MSGKHILVVEDERDMAELVAMRLEREHYDVSIAHDGVEGLDKARAAKPDLIVLDVMLPRLSGTDLLRQLRDDPATSNIAVVMLTARGEEGDMVAGLQIGADDYVTKPFKMAELVARIAAVLRRAEPPAAKGKGTLTVGPVEINQETYAVSNNGKNIQLTLTEFRLLVAIVSGRGRVLSRDQLIDRAIGQDAVVTDRTIDVHLAALRRKLGKARSYIQTVRGVGYRLAEDE
jgi:two-component system phosphate regulon response regulator PhoB